MAVAFYLMGLGFLAVFVGMVLLGYGTKGRR